MFESGKWVEGMTCSRIEISDLEMCLEKVYSRYETGTLNAVLV